MAIPGWLQEQLGHLMDQVRELVLMDDPRLARLFPPAYAQEEDADKQEEYRRLMAGDLIEHRLATFDVIEATLGADVIDEEQLQRWMQGVNAVRLVLGTILDVSDDSGDRPSPDDPRAPLHDLYELLGLLLQSLVDAALEDGRSFSAGLNPPTEP